MGKSSGVIIPILISILVFLYPLQLLGAKIDPRAHISSIKIISPIEVTLKDMEKRCGLKKGITFSPGQIRKCVIESYKAGDFRDIMVNALETPQGIELSFIFLAKIRIKNIHVRGNRFFSTRKIKAITNIKWGEEWTENLNREIKKRLIEGYKRYGFFDVKVNIKVAVIDANQKAIIDMDIHEGPRAHIGNIVFEGDTKIARDKLLELLLIHSGDPFDQDKIDKTVDRLRHFYENQGYVKILINPPDLLYNENTGMVDVTFSIKTGPRVIVKFEGVKSFRIKKLRKELTIWKERAFDEPVLEDSKKKLLRYYHSKGYYFADISYRTRKTDDTVVITFSINEGKIIKVGKIYFTGNRYFSTRFLKRYIRVRPNHYLIEEDLQEDIQNIINLYKNEGFLQVKVDYSVELNEESYLEVRINIKEGIQTMIKDIIFTGNRVFHDNSLQNIIKSRPGSPYSETTVLDDLYSIQSHYIKNGYIYARVRLRTQFSRDKKRVVVEYLIHEDKPVYIGHIYIRGNTYTKTRIIRRELLIKEGEPFSYEKILRTKRELLRLGIFKSVEVEPVRPQVKEYIKDVNVVVEDGYAGTVEIGIGYGDVEKLRGLFAIAYKNLFGTNREISLKIEGSSIEQKYNAGYREPWLFGYKMDGRFNMVDVFEHKQNFDRRTLGLTAGIDKSFSEFVKGSIIYQYEDVKLFNVSPGAILTPEDTGKTEVATINPSLIIDRRDDPFNPTRGVFYSFAFREAARILGSRPQFAKVNMQISFFHTLFDKTVFATSVRSGIAWNFGESKEVPIFERYFIGGRSTVRGYDFERLGIPGKTVIFDGHAWSPTGGNMMFILNNEIRFPLYGNLGFVIFMDSGNVWRKIQEFKFSEIRSTVGGGIRYNTPIGPFRLDVGCKLDREKGEDRCRAHFTLGHAF